MPGLQALLALQRNQLAADLKKALERASRLTGVARPAARRAAPAAGRDTRSRASLVRVTVAPSPAEQPFVFPDAGVRGGAVRMAFLRATAPGGDEPRQRTVVSAR